MESLKPHNFSFLANAAGNTTNNYFGVDQEVETLYILMYVLSAVMVLPGVFGNGLIILLVIKQHKLKTPTNYLIASLAVADLLMIIVMIAFVLMDRFPIHAIPLSVIIFLFPSFDIVIGSASIWSLAAVSVDRGIAVLRPLRYNNMINARRVKIVTLLIWCYSLALYIFSMLRIKVESYTYRMSVVFASMVISFVIPCFLIVISYGGILLSTMNSIRMTRALEKAISIATSRGVETLSDKAKRKRRVRSREVRLALNIMIILLPFTCGWGFYFGTHWYEILAGDANRSNVYEFFLLVIPWINSSINPLVYILLTKSLRKGCRQFICRRRDPFAKDSVFTTAIFSSISSRRPSWFERSMSVSSNGDAKNPKKKKSVDSRRGSLANRKQSFVVTLVPSEEQREDDELN